MPGYLLAGSINRKFIVKVRPIPFVRRYNQKYIKTHNWNQGKFKQRKYRVAISNIVPREYDLKEKHKAFLSNLLKEEDKRKDILVINHTNINP